jgi:O-antigen ligase
VAGILAVDAAALLATRTRGAIGGALVGIVVVLYTTAPPRRRADLLLAGGLLVAMTWLLFSSQLIDFVLRGEGVDRLASFNSRTQLWEEALRLAAEQPFLGHGLAASDGLFFTTTGLGGGHNALFNVLTDAGLLGVAAWVTLLVVLAHRLLRLGRLRSMGDGPLLLGVFVCLLVDAVTYEGLGTPATVASLWLFVLVGWVSALERAPARKVRRQPALRGRGGPATTP